MERWQGVCQRLAEHEKVTLVITGSSSKLSSEEIATKFRGRSHSHEMLPLSFREFCLFQAVEGDRLKGPAFSPQTQTFLEGLFDRYLTEGGFPGVQNRLNEDRIELLQSYVRDVVARDRGRTLGPRGHPDRQPIRPVRPAQHGLRVLRQPTRRKLQGTRIQDLLGEGGSHHGPSAPSLPAHESGRARLRAEASDHGDTEDVRHRPGHRLRRLASQPAGCGKRFETAVYLELRRRMAGKRTESITSYTAPGPGDRRWTSSSAMLSPPSPTPSSR